MHEIFNQIETWIAGGLRVAVATVTKTWGSAPRREGSVMAISSQLNIVGSVSGGCVENAVIQAAQDVMTSGARQYLDFGISNEEAWSVGLTCGGKLEVTVEPCLARQDEVARTIWKRLIAQLQANESAILINYLDRTKGRYLLFLPDSGEVVGAGNNSSAQITETAQAIYEHRTSALSSIDGESVFFQIFARKPRLIVIGAAHISVPLVSIARQLEYELVVVDPRRIFADAERFEVQPDRMIAEWPQEALPKLGVHEDDAAILLTHDPKIDDPALHYLLETEVRYIGALGSRKTHEKRVKRLIESGFTQSQIDRVQGPAGLAIGALTPEEIALSIMAEITQNRRNR